MDTLSGTATANEILAGYTAWVNGIQLTGNATGSPYVERLQVSMNGSYFPFSISGD